MRVITCPENPGPPRAACRPSWVLATISSRWSSASTESMPNMARPSAVAVSMPWSMTCSSTPRSRSSGVYTDHASGTLDRRPELDAVLAQLRPGDPLVVWRLDRLGRSLRHLIDTVTSLDERHADLAAAARPRRRQRRRRARRVADRLRLGR